MLPLALASVACDIPTAAPEVETRWVVPAEETRFGVAELLPGDVTVSPDLSAFIVNFDPVSFSQTLGSLCPACVAANGFVVPKPPFIGDVESGIAFPPEVVSIEILDGSVELQLYNGLNFDPIRPAPDTYGSLSISITDANDGDPLGSLQIRGQDTAFGQGTTLVRSVALLAATVEGPLTATVQVVSPSGDPVQIDTSLPVSVTATPTNVRVARVEVEVAGRSVTLDPVALDVEDIDTEVVERVVEGAFVLDVTNPFAVGADFQITISGPTIATIQKSVTIGPEAASTERLVFSGDEIRSFLGQPNVTLSGGAVVDTGAGPITILPGQELVLQASLDLTIRIGG